MTLVQAPARRNRIPPHNLDAEQSVLGAMLESKEAIANVIEVLNAEDFYKPAHATVYSAIMELYAGGQPADAITVAEELARRGELENIGGRPYILGLLEAYPTASSAAHYARIVEEHALLRRLIEAGNLVQEIGFSMPEDVEDAVDKSEEIIYQVGDRRLRDDVQPIHKLLVENMEAIEALYDRGEHVTGVASGFPDLDEMTAGFQPSNLVIVAARPSMGKCLNGNAKIVDPATGERLTIQDFVERRRPATASVGLDGSIHAAAVSDWVESGSQECFRLTTRSGRSIEATANHPLLTVSGWVPLRELQSGMGIAVPRALPYFGGDRSWPLARVRRLGYRLARGRFAGRRAGAGGALTRYASRRLLLARIRTRLAALFAAERVRKTSGVGGGAPRGRASPVTRLLSRLRRPRPALRTRLRRPRTSPRTCGLPQCVWRFDRARFAELLKVLFSCDGAVWQVAGVAGIALDVASEALARDIQHALLRFGVVAELRRASPWRWRLAVSDPTSVGRYEEEIGWIGERAPRSLVGDTNERGLSGDDVPQEAWELVHKALEARAMSPSDLMGDEEELSSLTKRPIARDRLAGYAEALDSDDLRFLANPDLCWDEVVSLRPVGPRLTYDLTVPEGSNFIANDICVHNSALMSDFALHAAVHQSAPVVVFSLEMSRHEMVQRFLSSQAKVDSQRLRRGSLQEQDWTRLSAALGRLAEAPVFIDDSASITLMEMRAKCRRLKAKHGLGLILIDYLQLMQSPRRSENRQQEVSEISRNLKILARELNVPVICASQLNRGVEYRQDKRPLLGDLRESGAIEQDADIVMFLYRDEVYNPDTEDKGEAELHVAKHRNGPTGKVRLAFMSQYTKFASFARGHGF